MYPEEPSGFTLPFSVATLLLTLVAGAVTGTPLAVGVAVAVGVAAVVEVEVAVAVAVADDEGATT